MAGFLNHYPPYPVNGLNMPPRSADMFSPMVAPPYGKTTVFIFRLSLKRYLFPVTRDRENKLVH